LIKRYFCLMSMILVAAVHADAQKLDPPTADTILMSNVITKRTGVATLAQVRARGDVHDIEVRFGGPLKDYRGGMNALVAAVATSSKKAPYKTDWCYIVTHEVGRERILVSDLIYTQELGLEGKRDEAWTYFESKKERVK
jgi:hypothetical protein